MSIEGKHAYRFGYLKSEQWKTVRIEALAREGGKCQICGDESVFNDAHHVWYPGNIYETTERHLVILCRSCHDFVHIMLPDCKTTDEEKGMQEWNKIKNAILAWRRDKAAIFQSGPEHCKAAELRTAYDALKQRCKQQAEALAELGRRTGISLNATLLDSKAPTSRIREDKNISAIRKIKNMISEVQRWTEAYLEEKEKKDVDRGDWTCKGYGDGKQD